MNAKLLVALGMTIAWFFLAASCSGESEDGGDSPEAVAERLREHLKAGTYGDILELTSPKDRDMMIATLMFAVGMLGSAEASEALDEKYGFSKRKKKLKLSGSDADIQASIKEWLGDTDRRAILHDLIAAMETMSPTNGEVSGIKIDGDRASGKLGDKPLRFVRLGGRWYLSNPTG